jgi:hypothetical protein
MNDRPTAVELVDAVRRYLEAELLPTLTDARLRFQTLIAANVLTIVGRELSSEEDMLREEYSLLNTVLGHTTTTPTGLGEWRQAVEQANRALCAQIRAGDFDAAEAFRDLSRTLRQTVVRKLQVANPKYLAST